MYRLVAMGKVPHPASLQLWTADGKTAQMASETAASVDKIAAFKLTEAGTVESIIVASLMKMNDWCKPHHSRTLISHGGSEPLHWLHLHNASTCVSPCSHHIKDEFVDVKVGLLLHAADDTALEHGASTLHLQARGVNTGQLEAFQVANAPR